MHSASEYPFAATYRKVTVINRLPFKSNNVILLCPSRCIALEEEGRFEWMGALNGVASYHRCSKEMADPQAQQDNPVERGASVETWCNGRGARSSIGVVVDHEFCGRSKSCKVDPAEWPPIPVVHAPLLPWPLRSRDTKDIRVHFHRVRPLQGAPGR